MLLNNQEAPCESRSAGTDVTIRLSRRSSGIAAGTSLTRALLACRERRTGLRCHKLPVPGLYPATRPSPDYP